MKTLLLLLMLVMAGFYHSVTQTSQHPGEVFIQQTSFDHNEGSMRFTGGFATMFEMDFDAFDESSDYSNTAIVNQYENDNRTGITQNGWGNKALVNLLGDNNTTGLVQNGMDNQFILNLEGNDNSVIGKQAGSQNRLRLDLIGTVKNQTFSQMGNNLTIELTDNSNGGIPMQIEQRGNGASVTIENH